MACLHAFRLANLLLATGGMPPEKTARPSSWLEVFLGRSLAMCVHPFAAWRSPALSVRMLILASYFSAGYAIAFTILILLA